MNSPTYVSQINQGLRECLQEDLRVMLWGEDILSPYGGAFKAAAGLSHEFPTRVLTTPISEAAIVGLAVGAALRGIKPIVEIMFGDFLTLTFDQLVNHAAKFPGMFNGQVSVPLVVRTPMGGYRSYGPTHSQSLEKHLLGVPGLRVVSASWFHNPAMLLKTAVLVDPWPVVFIESKMLYSQASDPRSKFPGLRLGSIPTSGLYPVASVRNYEDDGRPDVVLVTHGGMSYVAAEAMQRLVDEEIRVLALAPADLSTTDFGWISEAWLDCGRLVILEEGTEGFSYGSELRSALLPLIQQRSGKLLSVAAASTVIPAEKSMEAMMLPSVERLIDSLLTLL